MIIDNKKDFNNTKFENKFKNYKENNQINNGNIFVKDIKEQKYSNPNSSNDMYDKSLAMLNERFNKGLISLDEFNKKCRQLGNRRNN